MITVAVLIKYLDYKSIQGFTCTDSIKKSEADLNQSATVRRRSGCEYTRAIIIPTKIILPMAFHMFLRIKTQVSIKKNLRFIKNTN